MTCVFVHFNLNIQLELWCCYFDGSALDSGNYFAYEYLLYIKQNIGFLVLLNAVMQNMYMTNSYRVSLEGSVS